MITNGNLTTDTHSEYVILTALPLQQWLHENASILHCTYITSRVNRLEMTTRVPTFCHHLSPLCLCSLLELILTNEESNSLYTCSLFWSPRRPCRGLIYLIERTSDWALCSSATRCWNQRREIIVRDSLP